MKKTRFSEEKIALALHRAADGTLVEEVCRKLGIGHSTFYRWKQRYGGLLPSEVKKLKQLEEKNRRLKQLVADLSLDKHAGCTIKKALGPDGRKALIDEFQITYEVSVRKICRLFTFSKSTYYYKEVIDHQAVLIKQKVKNIAAVRVRYGYRRIHVLLKREGINHKRLYRLYCELNLQRPKRRVQDVVRRDLDCWSMDFMADRLFTGDKITDHS